MPPPRFPCPPALPDGAIGFLALHIDRKDRFALYAPTGEMRAIYGRDDTPASLAAEYGMELAQETALRCFRIHPVMAIRGPAV